MSEPRTWQQYMRLMRAALRGLKPVRVLTLRERVMSADLGGGTWPPAEAVDSMSTYADPVR